MKTIFQRFFLVFALAITMLTLTGCETFGGGKVVKDTKVIFKEVPEEYMKDCEVDTPPGRTEYLAADYQAKEALLSTHARTNLKNLGKCNADKALLRKWNEDQKKIYTVPKDK